MVYLTDDDKNRPQDGNPVYKWDGRATDWDTPKFDGVQEHVGFLKSRKVGRKTVWNVVPALYHMSVGTDENPNMRRVRSSQVCFSLAEALRWARSVCKPGESVWAHMEKSSNYSPSAAERVGAPTEEALAKMTARLVTGPWPAEPANPDTLNSDEMAAANQLLVEGKAVLHADEYKGDGEPPEWHGKLYYKATSGLLGLRSSSYKLRAFFEGEHVVFTGGQFGDHSLGRLVSSPERIRAHWEGYCESNGAQAL